MVIIIIILVIVTIMLLVIVVYPGESAVFTSHIHTSDILLFLMHFETVLVFCLFVVLSFKVLTMIVVIMSIFL